MTPVPLTDHRSNPDLTSYCWMSENFFLLLLLWKEISRRFQLKNFSLNIIVAHCNTAICAAVYEQLLEKKKKKRKDGAVTVISPGRLQSLLNISSQLTSTSSPRAQKHTVHPLKLLTVPLLTSNLKAIWIIDALLVK